MFCIYFIIQLLCFLASPRSLSAQNPSQSKILVNPRSQSAQDPSQPKIPVSPRSQSTLDASMPIWLMPILLMSIWLMPILLMPIWYLAHVIVFGLWKIASTNFFKHILHTYLDFSHAYLPHVHFSQSKSCETKIERNYRRSKISMLIQK